MFYAHFIFQKNSNFLQFLPIKFKSCLKLLEFTFKISTTNSSSVWELSTLNFYFCESTHFNFLSPKGLALSNPQLIGRLPGLQSQLWDLP